MKRITVKAGEYTRVDAEGNLSRNIRPNVHNEGECEVVKEGFSWHNNRANGMYAWYVVRYGAYGYSFVRASDVRW